MVGEGRVMMSVKEFRRVHVICQTMEKKLTQVKTSTLLGLTPGISDASSCEGAGGRPRARTSGMGKALELADPGAGQDQGAETLREATWGLGPDVGGGEVGQAVRDCGERGDATGLAPGEGGDTLHAADEPASGMAEAEGACG
jgi:hypothetical protein